MCSDLLLEKVSKRLQKQKKKKHWTFIEIVLTWVQGKVNSLQRGNREVTLKAVPRSEFKKTIQYMFEAVWLFIVMLHKWVIEVLWHGSCHMTSRHLCGAQLYQHRPVRSGQAASVASGQQCFTSGAWPVTLTVCLCVFRWRNTQGTGKRAAPVTTGSLWGIQIIPLCPWPPCNHALSKQTLGVRGKAISTEQAWCRPVLADRWIKL